MKKTAFTIVATGSLLVLFSPGVFGQEYFNSITSPAEMQQVTPATAGTPDQNIPAERVDISNPGLGTEENAASATSEQTGNDKYNMALGPVHFSLAAGVALEYNSNIDLGPKGQQISDFGFLPSLTLDSSYQFSELNTLRFSLGASYAAYLNHSEFDTRGVLLSPNSLLAFTMHVSNVAITFRDRFSYQEDPFDLPVLSGVAVYRHFENQAGIQLDWAVNEMLKITGGYDHYNLWTFDSEFASLQHSVDTVYLKPSYAITPAVTVGVDASVNWVDFSENIQNNGTNYMGGVFAEVALSQNTHVYAEGGISDFQFQHTGTVADFNNSDTWYAQVDIANRISEAFTQRLNFTKSTEVGFGTNFYELYHLEYALDWKIMQNLTLDPSLFFEHYKTSAPLGEEGESADRYGASIGLRYILTPSVTLGLDYRYIYKTSDLGALYEYQQNLVLLSLYYNF